MLLCNVFQRIVLFRFLWADARQRATRVHERGGRCFDTVRFIAWALETWRKPDKQAFLFVHPFIRPHDKHICLVMDLLGLRRPLRCALLRPEVSLHLQMDGLDVQL